MLTGVKQLDDKGAEVSYQKSDYYDDVQAAKGMPWRAAERSGIPIMTDWMLGSLNPITAVVVVSVINPLHWAVH